MTGPEQSAVELTWRKDQGARWDADKARIVGGAPAGALDMRYDADQRLPGDWWSALRGDSVVGVGWLDATWGGDAEIGAAVAQDGQNTGVGTFVMQQLEREAAARGMNYVYNVVRETHPDRERVHDWLLNLGYRGSEHDGALRKRAEAAPTAPGARAASGSAAKPTMRPPGAEESGGYVDIEDHRY